MGSNIKRLVVKMLGVCYPLLAPFLRVVYADEFIFAATAATEKLLIIAPPKVGSTWLSVMLEELLGWKSALLAPAYCRREQEIDVRKLVVGAKQQIIYSHQHLCYSEYTEKVILRTNIKCVLMTRDIKDTIVSFIDHCDRHGFVNSLFYMDDNGWNGLSYEEKVDRVVTLVLPWYFKFYAGWFSNISRFGGQMIVVRYEDMVQDPQAELKRIVDGFGLKPEGRSFVDVVVTNDQATLKNVGVVGRGQRLQQETVDKIMHMASFYPDVDFRGIGLSAPTHNMPPQN